MSYRERKTNTDGTFSQLTHITGSDVQQPVEIQGRYSQTIQTHNAVSVGANGTSASTFFDVSGYDRMGITVLNAVSGVTKVDVYWSHDGTTVQGYDKDVINVTSTLGAGDTAIKARYARLTVVNGDAGAAHTMSAWAYLRT